MGASSLTNAPPPPTPAGYFTPPTEAKLPTDETDIQYAWEESKGPLRSRSLIHEDDHEVASEDAGHAAEKEGEEERGEYLLEELD
jgi:hypothetical protein